MSCLVQALRKQSYSCSFSLHANRAKVKGLGFRTSAKGTVSFDIGPALPFHFCFMFFALSARIKGALFSTPAKGAQTLQALLSWQLCMEVDTFRSNS